MNFDVGPYRMSLPTEGVVLEPKRYPPTQAQAVRARVGPFELTARTSASDLEGWRNHVVSTTNGRTPVQEIQVNGMPGLTIPELPGNSQRLDYIFMAKGCDPIEIVAWSDRPTTDLERAAVREVINTLSTRGSRRGG
jgi:hypothetical protein